MNPMGRVLSDYLNTKYIHISINKKRFNYFHNIIERLLKKLSSENIYFNSDFMPY